MDLIGDIVEHDVSDENVEFRLPETAESNTTGFPSHKKSRFKDRLKKKSATAPHSAPQQPQSRVESEFSKKGPALNESEKIHLENLQRLSQLSEEEIISEQQELLQNLDPAVLQSLYRRISERDQTESTDSVPGPFDWVGGEAAKWGKPLDNKDIEPVLVSGSTEKSKEPEIPQTGATGKIREAGATDSVGIETVHFPRPPENQDEKRDDFQLNGEKDFFDELHDKYFPDLPKEPEKLQWMQPVDSTKGDRKPVYEDVKQIRFDFHGNMLSREAAKDISVIHGLHHHGEDPGDAGYTIVELARLARSSFPGQRSIAIRTLGRILYKLGRGVYDEEVEYEGEDGEDEKRGENGEKGEKQLSLFRQKMNELIEDLRVIESLQEAADEIKTRNITVRSYALDALWLWKSGENAESEESAS